MTDHILVNSTSGDKQIRSNVVNGVLLTALLDRVDERSGLSSERRLLRAIVTHYGRTCRVGRHELQRLSSLHNVSFETARRAAIADGLLTVELTHPRTYTIAQEFWA